MKVLEVDQWTSTGNVSNYTMNDFDINQIDGGDAKTVRALGIASFEIKEVSEDARPRIGYVWFKDGEDGKLEKYKANYDSSDWQKLIIKIS